MYVEQVLITAEFAIYNVNIKKETTGKYFEMKSKQKTQSISYLQPKACWSKNLLNFQTLHIVLILKKKKKKNQHYLRWSDTILNIFRSTENLIIILTLTEKKRYNR